MAKLPKFELIHDKKKDDWVLRQEGADRATRRFDTKEEATKGGVLESAVGKGGGSVRIKKLDGTIQEERTFPRSADPNETPG
ncbi:DUF2188 domain-containing protein [Mesorhizobium caraganae]|uniref:DUF2188 domain-containing protein n=1 Tax=Mesorhizobium caraganae TaxID=483206 RepID=UPI0017852367|nr:DUF2188 domain-containing protein [Mesorhizobium caraganae]